MLINYKNIKPRYQMGEEKKKQQELMDEAIKKVEEISDRVKLVGMNYLFKQIAEYTDQMEKEIKQLNKKYDLQYDPLI